MKYYDLIGLGTGPANLSLAALLNKCQSINAIFIEKQIDYNWHQGMLLSGAKLQVSHLKDLVTLVDPTNAYSFLNYLNKHGRIYQFITAAFSEITRFEFNQYLKWVFNQMDSIKKGEEINYIDFNDYEFIITTSKSKYTTKNLVLGLGLKPYIPSSCKTMLNEDVYHNSDYLNKNIDFTNKTVAVIGGGQSGAEIVNDLIKDNHKIPKSVLWFSKRLNFLPIDNSPFTNELFTPKYTDHFFNLENSKKLTMLSHHRLASDGISEFLSKAIYHRMYELNFIYEKSNVVNLFPSQELIKITKKHNQYLISILNMENHNVKEILVDKVILCTGYTYQEPDFLAKIQDKLQYNENGLIIDRNYKVHWEGMDKCSIYIQNGSKHTHGIADPNLSLLAYRSAMIINEIAGNPVYADLEGTTFIDWKN